MNLLVCSADLPLTVLRLEVVRSGHCTPVSTTALDWLRLLGDAERG